MFTVVLVGVVLAIPLTRVMRNVAFRYGMVDKPRGNRIHTVTTPYLGGVAVSAAALTAAVVGWSMAGTWTASAAVLCIASLAIAALGMLDDRRNLSPWKRLGAESVAALAVIAAGGVFTFTGVTLADAALTILVVVVLTNSYNLLDNSDAALASVAVVTGLGVTALALITGGASMPWLAAGVAGACLGFLVFNWPPARIFLGDAGSLFIGFALLGSLALTDLQASSEDTLSVCLGVFLVPIADTVLVSITRRREGRSILDGGRDHLHHRLARNGLGTAGAAIAAACLSALGILLAAASLQSWLPTGLSVAITVALMGGVVLWGLSTPSGSHRSSQDARILR